MKKYLGILGLLIVTIVWGGGFVASDIALESMTTLQIMTVRFFIGTVIMTILAFKKIKNITKEELKCGILLGVFLFGAFFIQTFALQFTTPSKNAFLTATNVVFVPFIAYIFSKKKASLQNIIGAALAIIGAGVLSLQSDFSLGLGDSLTLVCAICFAFQIYLTGVFVEKIRPEILNFLQMATAFSLSLVGLLFSGEALSIAPSQDSILAVLYLGLISTAFSYFLQTISQKYVDETKAAIILSTESVFGMLFSVIILSEQVTSRMILGAAIIFGAVLISEVKFSKKKKAG